MKKLIALILILFISLTELPVFAIGTHKQVDNYILVNEYSLTPELISYASNLSKKIKKNWSYPKINNWIVISYEINIDKAGNLIDTKFLTNFPDNNINMENNLFIKSAEEAIIKTFPYNPLPKTYSKDNIKIIQTFAVKPRRKVVDIYKVENKRFLRSLPVDKKVFISNYQDFVLRELNTSWLPPYYKPRKKILVEIGVDPNGSINNVKIIQSSGSKSFDDIVVNYLEQSKCTPSGEKVTIDIRVFSYGLSKKDSVMVGILAGSLSVLSLPIIYYMGLE